MEQTQASGCRGRSQVRTDPWNSCGVGVNPMLLQGTHQVVIAGVFESIEVQLG